MGYKLKKYYRRFAIRDTRTQLLIGVLGIIAVFAAYTAFADNVKPILRPSIYYVDAKHFFR
jgi:hypothetical protein